MNGNLRTEASLAFCAILLCTSGASATDWPQWRGPSRDGISQEKGLLKQWPAEGPKLVWHQTNIGSGYAAPSVVGSRIFVLGNEGLENEFAQALSAPDGKRIWSTRLGNVGNPKQSPNFPAARSTPTVQGEVLYALGSDGDLACVETAAGKIRWHKNLRTDFAGKSGDWAYAESPLIDGDTLVCTPGGAEATMLALNKNTGEVIWKSAFPEADQAAYASAVIMEAAGFRQYVQLLNKGLAGVEAKTGKLLWRYTKATSAFNANIPSPLVAGDCVYVASAGTGAGTLKLKPKDGGVEVETLYFNQKLPSAIGGAIKLGDFLYATTGKSMQCLDFATGQVKWEAPSLGAAALCYADGNLYLHGENGAVALVEATSEGYNEKGRFNPPDQPKRANQLEKAWAYPVVANGRLYIRDHGNLWCYEIR